VLAFFNARKIKSRGSIAIRKYLHGLYKIARHLQVRQASAVQDPDHQNVLHPVATTI
jgi:hypothetical protein